MNSCNNTTDSLLLNNTINCTTSTNEFSAVQFQIPTIVYVSMVIQLILIFTIFLGNSLVILLVARFRRLHSITNFFIACLSGADVGLSIAMIPGVVITFNPLFGSTKYKCLLLWCSIIFTSSASCFTLLVVTFDRYLKISRPLLYPILMTPTGAVLLMSFVWAYTFLFAVILPFAGVNEIYKKSFFICFEFTEVFSAAYLHIYFYLNGLLPFFVMCIIYGMILKIVFEKLRSANELAPANINHQGPNNVGLSKQWFRKEFKSIKTLIIVLGFTGAAWLPSSVIFLMNVYNPSYVPGLELRTYISWFSYLNSAVNPIIYALRSEAFRSAAFELFCKGGRVAGVFGWEHSSTVAPTNTDSTRARSEQAVENIT